MPELSNSSSEKKETEQIPSWRLRQNSASVLAAGNRPAIPIIAIASTWSVAGTSVISISLEWLRRAMLLPVLLLPLRGAPPDVGALGAFLEYGLIIPCLAKKCC